MNQRFKQLAQQAGMYVDLNGKPWPKSMSAEECEVAYKKFAQLIVQECVQTLIDNTPERYASEDDWDRGYARAMEDCVHHIQEHFGVES